MTKRLTKDFRHLPYDERQRQLGLHSLSSQRLRGNVRVVYKMFNRGLIFASASALSGSVVRTLRGGERLPKLCCLITSNQGHPRIQFSIVSCSSLQRGHSGSVAVHHATSLGHGVKVSYTHNRMQLLQDTTNAYSQFPDNHSVCALRTLEVTH